MKLVKLMKMTMFSVALATGIMAQSHAQSVQSHFSGYTQFGTHATINFTLATDLTNVWLGGLGVTSVGQPILANFALWKGNTLLADFIPPYVLGADPDDPPSAPLGKDLSAGDYTLTVSDGIPAGATPGAWVDHPYQCDPTWPHCQDSYDWGASFSGDSFTLPAVPEPTTPAMLVAGLGLFGLMRQIKARQS